jgi:hypothetical protein
MKTLILRIGAEENGPPSAYPVELLELQRDEKGWCEHSLARCSIPVEAIGGAPAVPPSGGAGNRDVGPINPVIRAGSEANHAAWLYDFVFQDEVGEKWHALTTSAPDSVGPPEGIGLILDVTPSKLRYLRWELMGKELDFPASTPNSSLVRGPVELKFLAPASDDVLKVLVVVGSAPKDENVMAEEEIDELETVFTRSRREVKYKLLKQPDRNTLSKELAAFHPNIFHFIGHGNLDENKQPYLYLHQAATGTDLEWRLDDILKDFNGIAPAFVFLNACHTVDRTDLIGAASMTDLFLDRIGARGVLGMHAAVRGKTAGRLAGKLYEALSNGHRLDLALTYARNQSDILKSNNKDQKWDWALPYLRLKCLPDQVLPAPVVPKYLVERLNRVPIFKQNDYFVDRLDLHEQFLEHIQTNQDRASNLLLIVGDKEIGKTQLIRCCLQAVARRGRLVKYVELDPTRPLNFLDVLRLICEGEKVSPISGPLPASALEGFGQTLNALKSGKDPRDKELLAKQPTKARWDLQLDKGDEEQVNLIFASFLEALQKIPDKARQERAEELKQRKEFDYAEYVYKDKRPFLLVLDQIAVPEKIQDFTGASLSLFGKPFKDYIVPQLIGPFARGEGNLGDILLVLGVTRSALEPLGLDAESLHVEPPTIRVPSLPADQFRTLAEEYFEKRGIEALLKRCNCPIPWRDNVGKMGEAFVKMNRFWSPVEILSLYSLLLGPYASQAP